MFRQSQGLLEAVRRPPLASRTVRSSVMHFWIQKLQEGVRRSPIRSLRKQKAVET